MIFEMQVLAVAAPIRVFDNNCDHVFTVVTIFHYALVQIANPGRHNSSLNKKSRKVVPQVAQVEYEHLFSLTKANSNTIFALRHEKCKKNIFYLTELIFDLFVEINSIILKRKQLGTFCPVRYERTIKSFYKRR